MHQPNFLSLKCSIEEIDVMTFAGVDIHSFVFPSILNNQDFVIAKSNQSEGGSVVKLRLLVVDLFAVKY